MCSASPATSCGGGSSAPVSARTWRSKSSTMRSASAIRPCCASQRGDSGRPAADPPDHERADRADDHHPAPAVEAEDRSRHQMPGEERDDRHGRIHDALVVGEGGPALLLGHQLGQIGVDVHQLDAEADAGDEPPQIDGLRRRLKRHDQRAGGIPEQREGEDRAAAEAVGEPAESERADEHPGEQRGDEAGEALQVEQALRGRLEQPGFEHAERDVGREEQIVELEPAAERKERDQFARVA